MYVSGHSDGSIIIVKNQDLKKPIILKEAESLKILGLKISGKHLVAMKEISSQKYKIKVYDLD